MKTNILKKYIKTVRGAITKISWMAISLFMITSCNNFVDVVPENVATIDHAFSNRREAERYLGTVYGRVPQVEMMSTTFFGADDLWTYSENHYTYAWAWKLALGEQNVSSPIMSYWGGSAGANNLFEAIREANIFIEQIDELKKVPELDDFTRARWIAEAKFLKAYFHFYLMRMYGPIPITDKNIKVSDGINTIRVKRDHVDDVANYIATTLDEAAKDLPVLIQNAQTEAGRVTRGAALMLKAKTLVTVASPLFNGNSHYADFVDKDGKQLISSTYSREKWEKAAQACADALESLQEVSLYSFRGIIELSERAKYQMRTRNVITERFNSEVIWGRYLNPATSSALQQRYFVGRINPTVKDDNYLNSYGSVTMNMVERFYTKNGVPITEDKDWDYGGRYNVVKVDPSDESQGYNIERNYPTAKLHLDRENRFYGSVIFDGAKVFLESSPRPGDGRPADANGFAINAKFGGRQGRTGEESSTVSGYWVNKLTSWQSVHNVTGFTAGPFYSWPEFRLADLYLLYAESLNEIGRGDDAIYFLDLIRDKVGLKGVKVAWQQHSTNPSKPNTIDGLREIIHQEREIELAFEGSRIWDLRRWRKAEIFQNKPVVVWNVRGKTAESFYTPVTIQQMQFVVPRDYLWPISDSELLKNPNLQQNPGW